jgi:hypothetical protein
MFDPSRALESDVTLVRLTDPNITCLKRTLRQINPDARTSHIAEALAKAFGQSTFAALLASIKDKSPSTAPLARFDREAFCRRLTGLGPCALMEAVQARLERVSLPDPCWKAFPDKDLAANNAWYATCRAENLPNICIRTRRKYVKLAWDCISLHPRYEHETHGPSGSALGRRMFERFQARAKGRPGKPIYMGSAFVGTVDPADPGLARQLADDFFEMLYEVTRTMKSAA